MALTVSRPMARSGACSGDPRQLGGPCREGVEAELEARGDRPADVGAVGRDDVERGGRPEVDDDRRRAVQADARPGR